MKQLYYTFRNLLHGRGNNLIKLFSLTLGLVVALVLFSKIAFEVGFDKSFPDAERIYRIQRKIYNDGKVNQDTPRVYAAVPKDLQSELSEIEDACLVMEGVHKEYLQYENHIYQERVLMGDGGFFRLFGIQILQGDEALADVASNLFLSQSAARRFFGEQDPIGQTIVRSDMTVTVAGVFKDIVNSHLQFDAFLSMKTLLGNELPGWHNPDPFLGYIKLASGVRPESVEEKIKSVVPKYMDIEAETANGNQHEFFLCPITELHTTEVDVKRILMVLSILAFSLLFVAAMNYVLISISSLADRAKSVGIHKCSGATGGNIFRMFIYETGIMLTIATLLAIMLIFAFRAPIEAIIQTPFRVLFSPQNLWIVVATLSGLLLLAGVIPAFIFSSVPVTHIFRTYATDKKYWKRMLLFVQFGCVAFMVTLLLIVVKQYNILLSNDLGYTTKNIYFTENILNAPREEVQRLKAELERLPQVESVTVSSNILMNSMNGISARNFTDENQQILTKTMAIDAGFLETFNIKLLAGDNVGESSLGYTRALVNKKFIEAMGWTDSPVGKSFITGLNEADKPIEIIGVTDNFKIATLNNSDTENIPPMILFPLDISADNWLFNWDRVIIKVHNPNSETIAGLNLFMQELTGRPNAFFVSYQSFIADTYRDTLLYRNSILAASLILLLITALGLFGFTQDEINRRSKEIAIRKIVGATAKNVLETISQSIVLISIPALLMGFAFSYVVGTEWLKQFTVKISLNLFLFSYSAVIVLAGILVCITARTWKVANENPVKHLRAE